MKENRIQRIFPILTVALAFIVMWVTNNQFIPIQEGWGQYYAYLTQKGLLPYRDFYYFTQPISLFILQIIGKISDGLMIVRLYGIIERLVLIVVFYLLISKHFSKAATFLAVTTSVFLYQSFNFDTFYTYYQTTLLFFLIALLIFQTKFSVKFSWLKDLLVGIFISLSFFTKQSNGLFLTLLFLFLILWKFRGWETLKRVFFYIVGWGIPAIAIIGWLIHKNIFSEYLQQVFGGSSAKGSIWNLLFGFWTRNHAMIFLCIFAFCAAVAVWLFWTKKIHLQNHLDSEEEQKTTTYLLLISIPLFVLAGLVIPKNLYSGVFIGVIGDYYDFFWMYFSFYLITVMTVLIIYFWLRRRESPIPVQIAELILAAFVWTYSSGLSGQLDLTSTLLATSLLIAFLFDQVTLIWKPYKFVLIVLCCLVVFVCSAKKNLRPIEWWGWTEFGHETRVESKIPYYKGFELSPFTTEVYDSIYLDIINNSSINDKVYTYPFMPMINLVTDRLQPTFSPVDYFDVCPDYIAEMDAQRLLDNPPKMIVYMEIPDWAYQKHEEFFRAGHPSGQRAIDSAVKSIVKEYGYETVDEFYTLGWGWKLYVWLKP